MTERTLLPCPFCGSEAVVTSPAVALGYAAQVGCTSCKAVVYGYGEEDAAEAWNHRHHGGGHETWTKPLVEFFATLPAPPVGLELVATAEPSVEVEACAFPSLAEVQALAERCKAGDLDAFREYVDAARALLDSLRPVTTEEIDKRRRIWEDIIKLNASILEAAPC